MKKIIKDIIYNLISSFALVFVIQFLIYPFLAKELSIEEYGLFLLSIGFINLISVGFSSSIGNLRLVNQKKYRKSSEYNNFLIISIIISTIFYMVITLLSVESNIYYLILIICMIYKNYHAYSFRIDINYKNTLMLNLITAIGYILGLTLFNRIFNDWIFIFLIGEVLGTIFILLKAETTKEKFEITRNKENYIQFFSLSVASLLNNSMMYIDRFVLFPILGSNSVSIFVVASFVGKSIGLVITPINSVFLTYIAKNKKIDIRYFRKTFIFLLFAFLIVFFITIYLGDYITRILYPDFFAKAEKYISISSLSALTFILGNVLNTFLLKMCNIKWQLRIQIIYMILYVFFGLLILKYYNLEKFIYLTIVLNIFRVAFTYFIIEFSNRFILKEEK